MTAPPAAAHPAKPAGLERLAPVLAGMIAGVVVFHRSLAYFFSQDDFLGLARAAGLMPRLAQPWRYIPNQAVWDLLLPFGTVQAWPYHLLSLIAHAACVALLHDLLARRLAPWAALLGATFFAVHPSLFTALYWISTVGDPLALCFGLLVLRTQHRTDRWRWLAVPLLALSLLCKESLLLLPLVVVAFRVWVGQQGHGATLGAGRTSQGRARPIDGLVLALAAVSLIYIVYFFTFAYGTYFVSPQDPVAAAGEAARAPYALGWGTNLWQNLLSYLGWSTAFALPVVHRFSDAVDPGVYPWAIGAIAIWIAGLAYPPLRTRGWLFGGVAWILFVVPALPLRHHTYHYYLYGPLAGAAWCVAAAADWALARPRSGAGTKGRSAAPEPRAAWLVAGACALLLTINGALLVRKIETMPFVLAELRAEPIVDRARIARNVYESLAAARLPPGVTLLFWSPTAASLGPRGEQLATPAPSATYWERNVRDALLGGLAVRVMFPRVADVRFVREFAPTPANEWYAAYRPDGRVRVATSAEVDSILHAAAAAR